MNKIECPFCNHNFFPSCKCCGNAVDPSELDQQNSEIQCPKCTGSFPAYLLQKDARNIIATIKKNLMAFDDGSNKDCWPLASFGAKDADLSPSGCTGIKRIVGVDGPNVIFEVGGHKTFCLLSWEDTDELDEDAAERYVDPMLDMIFDAGYGLDEVECSGECTAYTAFTNTISVQADAGAAAIIEAAWDVCNKFERAMASAETRIDEYLNTCT